jgi:hypothetical protein
MKSDNHADEPVIRIVRAFFDDMESRLRDHAARHLAGLASF